MASREPINLVFGGESYKVRPLTFKQVQSLSKLFAGSGEGVASRIDLARSAVEVALSRDHKDVVIDDLECDASALPRQLIEIMQLGGFQPEGEVPAAAGTSASIGDTSAGV